MHRTSRHWWGAVLDVEVHDTTKIVCYRGITWTNKSQSFAHGQCRHKGQRIFPSATLCCSGYIDFCTIAGLMQFARTASGVLSGSHPHACKTTLCAVCSFSFGICASVVRIVLRTDFPSTKEQSNWLGPSEHLSPKLAYTSIAIAKSCPAAHHTLPIRVQNAFHGSAYWPVSQVPASW